MRVDEVRDEDAWGRPRAAGEGAEARGLAHVVELLAEARAHDVEHRLRVEAPAAEDADERPEERRVGEIALHRARDAGVLHLDGDLAPVVEAGAVHLADGGAGEGRVVPLGEERVDGRVELLLDERADGRGRRARRLGAQRLERRLERRGVLLGYQPVDVARHLADLRREATQVAQHLGRVLGRGAASAVDQHARAGAHAHGGETGEAAQARLGKPAFFGHRACRRVF